MRNLKSMVAFLVVAAMLFASCTAFAYNDVAEDANYASAVETLSALSILKGDDQGNFNPDNTITRAESAAVIVRLLGLEDQAAGAAASTQFADVAADHWASGYVNLAAQAGIIAGYGDGNFGPEDPVTYEQFVKMLVVALGYEPKALTKGTYPSGYLIAANEMKLTKDVSGSAGQEAARKVVAMLAFNALDIPLMEQAGWGSDISYEIQDGNTAQGRDYKTLLTEKLDIYKVYGSVSATAVAGSTKNGTVKYTVTKTEDVYKANNDFIAGNTVVAYVNDTNADDMLGFTTYAYFKPVDGEDKYDMLAIYKISGKDEVLTIDPSDITSIQVKADLSTEIIYDDEDDVSTTVTIASVKDASGNPVQSATYYLNGKDLVATAAATIAAPAEGSVQLIMDTNYDDVATAMFIESWSTAVVDKYDASRARIVLKGSGISIPGAYPAATNYIRLDSSDTNLKDLTYTLVDVNGNNVDVEDLKEYDVLTVKAYSNNSTYKATKRIDMIVSTASVEGVIGGRKTVDGIVNWTIGGQAYTVATDVVAAPALALKDEGTFYLNAFGKIAYKEASSVSGDWAFVYKVVSDTVNAQKIVTVLGKDGVKKYTLPDDEKVNYNGTSVNGNTITLPATWAFAVAPATKSDAQIADQFVELTVDADGVITKLVDSWTSTEDPANNIRTNRKYYEATSALGTDTWLSSDVVVYQVAKNADELDDLTISSLSALSDGDSYDVIVLDTDSNTGKATAIAVTQGAASANIKNPIAIVTGINYVADGNTDYVEYEYLTEGAAATIREKGTTANYAVGDVLVLVKDSDGLLDSATKKVAKLNTTITDNDAIDDSLLVSFASDVSKRKFYYGTVAEKKDNNIKLTVAGTNDTGVTTVLVALADSADAYVINLNKQGKENYITVGDALDVIANEANVGPTAPADDVAHYALVVLDEDNALVSIIIVEPQDGVYTNLGL